MIFAFYALSLGGCVTTQIAPISVPPGISGTYHRVKKGQTLWRISKMYNVDLDELININRVSDTTNIEVGQTIFIPEISKQQIITNSLNLEDFSWPVKGRVITAFGQTINNMINKGINIQAHKDSNVVACRSGRIIFYSPDFYGFGRTIIIDHGDGFSTLYARNSEVFVKVGDNVTKGMTIAKVGSAGRDKDIYLHFEIRKGHIPQNPYFYLP